ncbi:hypothetical protein phiPsal1_050 [Pontimonas phage phiPsal1]|nr:hypothetical protein phiPsal1_050 [Pontimonas phage phiPsal1]
MGEYTPDDNDLRAIYLTYSLEFSDDRPAGEDYGDGVRRCEAEFARWLAQHDAEVAEAERERILYLIEDEAACLIANGDLGSQTLVMLGKLQDFIEGEKK